MPGRRRLVSVADVRVLQGKDCRQQEGRRVLPLLALVLLALVVRRRLEVARKPTSLVSDY